MAQRGIIFSESAVERVNAMQSLIQARALKAQYKIANKRDLTLYFDEGAKEQSVILENQDRIQTLAGFAKVMGIKKSEADGMVAISTLGNYLSRSSRRGRR